jgi:hypothetical protein
MPKPIISQRELPQDTNTIFAKRNSTGFNIPNK